MIALTAIFEQQQDGSWIGWVEELSGANTQGETFKEVKENLLDAIQMVLEARREEAEQELKTRPANQKVIREQYCFA